jgi:hypothetical protein
MTTISRSVATSIGMITSPRMIVAPGAEKQAELGGSDEIVTFQRAISSFW